MSPIRHLDKPLPKRREQFLTRAEFDTLLSVVKDRPFRDVLVFCWETGCRVQEVRVIESSHYKVDRGRIELPPALTKGKKRMRLIYLTPLAKEVVSRLALKHRTGPIFRNLDDAPWKAQAFNCRFCHIAEKVGVKYSLTSFRHSFATRLLEAHVDHIAVATLLGHKDATMLAQVYQHVGQRDDFLLVELLKGSNGESGV
jgi:integrase